MSGLETRPAETKTYGETRFRENGSRFCGDGRTGATCADVAGTGTAIWPGIDIDVPTPRARCSPESVRQATLAALRAGAQGVLLSRAYLEMKPENLRGAGLALEEFAG